MKRIFELINRNLFVDKIREMLRKEPSTTHDLPLITISREMGSGGRPIAHMVAKKLGKPWKVYHEEIVDEIAKQTKLEKLLVKEIDEKRLPLIEEMIGDIFGRRYMNFESYHKHLIKILLSVGHLGSAIIMGRGAHYLFPHALKVRLIAEMPQRLKWITQFEHVSQFEAAKRIDRSDKERGEFERTVYVPKYQRFTKKKTRLHARLNPAISVVVGDYLNLLNFST